MELRDRIEQHELQELLREQLWMPHLLFVYGTLRYGFGNYQRYLKDSLYVGKAITDDHWPLICDGLPYLYPIKGLGERVVGDVFAVTAPVLASIDRLEGHPDWYARRPISVMVDGKLRLTVTQSYFTNNNLPQGEYKMVSDYATACHGSIPR